MLSGYHSFRLTDRYVDSTASQVGYIPFDYKRQKWFVQGDWRWRALGLRQNMLPELFKPGSEMGKISKKAAQQTGIPVGLPLIASGSDKACEVLGSGCISPNIGSLSYGTTATYNVTSERYFEASKPMPPYPAALPNNYNAEIMIQRGYWMVSWFKKEFGGEVSEYYGDRLDFYKKIMNPKVFPMILEGMYKDYNKDIRK
jgi:sugar (pentulose or hexulose) kinase